MPNAKKKPPINLRELEDEVNEEIEEEGGAQPGELSYMKREDRRGQSAGPTEGRDWFGLATSVVISVVLAGILIFTLTPAKKDIRTLRENQEELNSGFTQSVRDVSKKVDESFTSLNGKVETAVVEARSTKSALDGYLRKGDVVIPDFSQYARISDIPAYDLSSYVQKATLAEYAKITALDTYATRSYVDGKVVSTPSGTSMSGWSLEVLPILRDGALELQTRAGRERTVAVRVTFEPINSAGVWTNSLAYGTDLTTALQAAHATYPVSLLAGPTKLTPQYAFVKSSETTPTIYLRSVEFYTPWFDTDSFGVTKLLTYEKASAAVAYKVTAELLPVAVSGIVGGW